MTEKEFISRLKSYEYVITEALVPWLEEALRDYDRNWWINCVIHNLTEVQIESVGSRISPQMDMLDLAALVRIADRNWPALRKYYELEYSSHYVFTDLGKLRNELAHYKPHSLNKDFCIFATRTYFSVAQMLRLDSSILIELKELKNAVQTLPLIQVKVNEQEKKPEKTTHESIEINDRVFVLTDPSTIGVVLSVTDLGQIKSYQVFINGSMNIFYEGQIGKVETDNSIKTITVEQLRSELTAYYLNSPGKNNLFSLSSSRIDFVPYQFRPVLKIIKADEPRILIADSVGVGKTIETGLIIKELDARIGLQNILVICPKALVSEHKWRDEMARFDQNFTELNSGLLSQIMFDCNEKGTGWPANYPKCILPYSLLGHVLKGNENSKTQFRYPGIENFRNPPHFDLVVVDEAHHIKNRDTDAYKAVKFFCDHADAVVFLTATPIQLGNEDLYTLLNLLRPDLVLDHISFERMLQPNKYVSEVARLIRGNSVGWQRNAQLVFDSMMKNSSWARDVIAKNPLYTSIQERLSIKNPTREERISLLSDIESLNTFSSLINRTRRRDIEDFCIRDTTTIASDFTSEQEKLYSKIIVLEAKLLGILHHNVSNVRFMMTTLLRQAASCIFGLHGFINDLLDRRWDQIAGDESEENDAFSIDEDVLEVIRKEINDVLDLSDKLDAATDPKLEAFLDIVRKKQSDSNNKVIVFSTFRHTLDYLEKALRKTGIRVARVDGSIESNERYAIRQSFAKSKNSPDSIDIILFSEVGSEGLDYQFCNTMINYDLPWNPMKIEQRIGRIDRRGQKSDVVYIFNMITNGTIDADIYYKCLERIKIFKQSIGDCEEILGAITAGINDIVMDYHLTAEQRRQKLEQMADSEIRKLNEIDKLEEQGKQFFGLDVSTRAFDEELRKSESYWVSPQAIRSMLEYYTEHEFGHNLINQEKALCINAGYREKQKILSLLPKPSNNDSPAMSEFRKYLKNNRSDADRVRVEFEQEKVVNITRTIFFLNNDHPMTRLAIDGLKIKDVQYIGLEVFPSEYKQGTYPFAIYSWEYKGFHPNSQLKVFCPDNEIASDLFEIISRATSIEFSPDNFQSVFQQLDLVNYTEWTKEKSAFQKEMESVKAYRIESKKSSYLFHRSSIEQALETIPDGDSISRQLQQGRMSKLEERFQVDIEKIEKEFAPTDIRVQLLVRGVVVVK